MPQIDPGLFQLQIDPGWLRVETWQIAVAAVCIAGFVILAIIWGVKAHQRQVTSGKEDLIGKTGEVKIALNPRGTILLQGELWTAISESGQIEPGEEVIITRTEGLKLFVKNKKV